MKINRSSGALIAISFALIGVVPAGGANAPESELMTPETIASIYVVDFVSTAAFGVAMNDAGDVVGTSYPDPGCGSSCLPVLETVAWRGGTRIVLPTVPGFSGITVTGINNQGWISGYAGLLGTTTHAVVWQPIGNSYTAIDLGTLPGTSASYAIGIDDQNRAVGWSATLNFPPQGSPFVWSLPTGMVDLAAQGFPDDLPLAISRGGTVAAPGAWYRLSDPASVTAVPGPPPGFFPAGGGPAAIDDAGDQLRFLASTGAENLVYPFRLPSLGSWQQISFLGTGHLTTYGAGSITPALDITATVQSTGMIAAGPGGSLQLIAPLVSPAYGGRDVTFGGPINGAGQILTQILIGNSKRLVRLVPGQPCTNNCIQVISIQMQGRGPDRCDQGSAEVKAKLTVKDELGVPLSGVRVTGHFLDDYWLDETVAGNTNANGQVTFRHVGPPCVGAIALLVTDAMTRPARTFDRTTGILTSYVIPLP
jgi:hypothetical protein